MSESFELPLAHPPHSASSPRVARRSGYPAGRRSSSPKSPMTSRSAPCSAPATTPVAATTWIVVGCDPGRRMPMRASSRAGKPASVTVSLEGCTASGCLVTVAYDLTATDPRRTVPAGVRGRIPSYIRSWRDLIIASPRFRRRASSGNGVSRPALRAGSPSIELTAPQTSPDRADRAAARGSHPTARSSPGGRRGRRAASR